MNRIRRSQKSSRVWCAVTLLTVGCDGDTDTDTDTAGDDPAVSVSWEPNPPSLETSGLFQHTVWKSFLWEDEVVSWSEPGTFAQAWFYSKPISALALNLQDGFIDVCWAGLTRGDASATYDDVGRGLNLEIGDATVEMQRESFDSSLEYWWYGEGEVPDEALAEGNLLVLDDAELGIGVVQPLELNEFDSTWAEFVQTGEMHLSWGPATNENTRIQVSISHSDRDTYSGCILEDDGEAIISFPGSLPADDYPDFTLISRVQPSWTNVRGYHIRTTSAFEVSHAGPDF